jgi:hypothetical protein
MTEPRLLKSVKLLRRGQIMAVSKRRGILRKSLNKREGNEVPNQ